MSAPVDVLAVMDAALVQVERAIGAGALPELAIARAAVAELLEADRELDAAQDALCDAKREKGNWRVNPLQPTHPAVVRVRAAKAHRAAALAQVQP